MPLPPKRFSPDDTNSPSTAQASTAPAQLPQPRFSRAHEQLIEQLQACDKLLIIQDLDGVCMGLVRDPRQRQIEARYLEAAKKLEGHFFVLSNGEHIGQRGVNPIVDQSLAPGKARQAGYYLPGLGAGGVQWQDCYGAVSHPGVSAAELEFLAAVPALCRDFLERRLQREPFQLRAPELQQLLQAAVLDNRVSPTVNINNFFQRFAATPQHYRYLQEALESLMQSLLQRAGQAGLGDSFFVHYAPNLGSDERGERILYGAGVDSGTTDFQFMLRGAVKEAGVLVILNQYYQARTGHYPLGEGFSVRQAPRRHEQLVALVEQKFDPLHMPHMVAVGDTVTSREVELAGQRQLLRGGSDRGFLSLVQALGHRCGSANSIVYVDSSGGEVRRPALQQQYLPAATQAWNDSCWAALKGISDPADPLQINYVFAHGHRQYVDFFCALARRAAARIFRQ